MALTAQQQANVRAKLVADRLQARRDLDEAHAKAAAAHQAMQAADAAEAAAWAAYEPYDGRDTTKAHTLYQAWWQASEALTAVQRDHWAWLDRARRLQHEVAALYAQGELARRLDKRAANEERFGPLREREREGVA